MVVDTQSQRLRRSATSSGRHAGVPGPSLVVRLPWGLGDVLLATSAIRGYRELHPDARIIFQTYVHNRHPHGRYKLEYPHGTPAEMLLHNPDIDELRDFFAPAPMGSALVDLRYAWFGGPSLDYPIQAHFWENLGLAWEPGQRFDSYYHMTEAERVWARERIQVERPLLGLTPANGWPGKLWSDSHWGDLITWALDAGYAPIVFAGHRLFGAPWDQRGVLNASGQLNIRQTAALLARCQRAVMLEGGLSNLRFALGLPAILLTCATLAGLQVWTPPELTTEIRMMGDEHYRYPGVSATGAIVTESAKVACEPCMWRREHVKGVDPLVPPAQIEGCPAGRSLRDLPASVVIEALEAQAA